MLDIVIKGVGMTVSAICSPQSHRAPFWLSTVPLTASSP